MGLRLVRMPHSLIVIVIAITALLSRLFYPSQWTSLDNARLLLWPQALLSAFILIMWVAVWAHSLKADRVHPLLALGTLGLTVLPLLIVAQSWDCIIGKCYW